MIGTPLKIMVDANVWADSFCADHAESFAARAFIGRAVESGATLLFPVHIAKDVLYVVQHELKCRLLAEKGSVDEASARAIGEAALAFVRSMTETPRLWARTYLTCGWPKSTWRFIAITRTTWCLPHAGAHARITW